jgi:ribulose kinase
MTSSFTSHYIGIDVGTGSARACIINDSGEIQAVHSETIQLWNSKTGYYVGNIIVTLPSR